MIIINKNNSHYILNCKINNNNNNNNNINFNTIKNSDLLFKSILNTDLLSFAFIENNNLHFQAESVYLLSDKIKININVEQILLMLFSISKQIISLEKLGYTFYGFSLNDVIIVNNTYFFILNYNYILPISNNYITFLYPFEKPIFTSPEILNVLSLPANITFKSIYYSLGVFIIYLLFNKNILKGNDILTIDEIDKILYPIYGCKLYWCIKRCLHINLEDRFLLYI
jgi:hypothetical protein